MITVNMHEAKSRLSQLVVLAIKGEEVIVCCHGQPRVRLMPVESPVRRRDLIPTDINLRVTLAPEYDPREPLSEDEWPSELR